MTFQSDNKLTISVQNVVYLHARQQPLKLSLVVGWYTFLSHSVCFRRSEKATYKWCKC